MTAPELPVITYAPDDRDAENIGIILGHFLSPWELKNYSLDTALRFAVSRAFEVTALAITASKVQPAHGATNPNLGQDIKPRPDLPAGAIEVPLHGVNGAGKTMILDADVWAAGLAAGWPEEWNVFVGRRSKRGYVVTHRKLLGRPGKPVFLCRVIAGASDEEAVRYRNGNSLDLRKENLENVPMCELPFLARPKAVKATGSGLETTE